MLNTAYPTVRVDGQQTAAPTFQKTVTPRIDTRQARAAGIVTAGDIHESRPGIFRIRDAQSGSGRWHIVTATSCTCADFSRTGLKCKHLLALSSWSSKAEQSCATGPTCPTCGGATRPEQFYAGGCYRFFACCTVNPEHQATRLS